MKVLVDLNVVLDVVLNRQPWVAESQQVWDAHVQGKFEGVLAATELTNLFYVVRRLANAATARTTLGLCLATFSVVAVDAQILTEAHRQAGLDFEDNVAIACALAASCDLIVTRDPTGFQHSPIGVVSPVELLARLAAASP